MKRLTEVLTAALLMAAMTMATGCSKEDSENMEEQQLNDIKQHIVGTWKHDGDFICADIKELSGTIKDGIISGCTSTFDDYNPATLTILSDGSFDLTRDDYDKQFYGTYSVEKNEITGEPWIWLSFTGSHTPAEIEMFDYHQVFFEKDYNTVYLVAHSWAIIVGRYRRN